MPTFTPGQLGRMALPDLLVALPQILAENQALDTERAEAITALGGRVTAAEEAIDDLPEGGGGAAPDVTFLVSPIAGGGTLTLTVTDGNGASGVVTLANTAGFNAPARTGAGTASVDIGGGLGDNAADLAALIAHAVLAMVEEGDLAVRVAVVVGVPGVGNMNFTVSPSGIRLEITDTSGEGPATAVPSEDLAPSLEVVGA